MIESIGTRASREHDLERYWDAGHHRRVSPLLGLLGTVVGMIDVQGDHVAGVGDPTAMAGGIAEALITTAVDSSSPSRADGIPLSAWKVDALVIRMRRNH